MRFPHLTEISEKGGGCRTKQTLFNATMETAEVLVEYACSAKHFFTMQFMKAF